MKTAVCKPYTRPTICLRYPNAATRRQVAAKMLDGILVAASGMGIAAALLLLAVF